jgi:hypothetical protein
LNTLEHFAPSTIGVCGGRIGRIRNREMRVQGIEIVSNGSSPTTVIQCDRRVTRKDFCVPEISNVTRTVVVRVRIGGGGSLATSTVKRERVMVQRNHHHSPLLGRSAFSRKGSFPAVLYRICGLSGVTSRATMGIILIILQE